MKLHEIGLKHKTDKATYHEYCDFYEEHLSYLQEVHNPTVLELGVLKEASLEMWREWLPNAKVWGADIIVKTSRYHKLVNCDTGNVDSLNNAVRYIFDQGFTGFDLIIDDASHTWADQQTAFAYLWPLTSAYIIEDVHTSLLESYASPGYQPTVVWDRKNNKVTLNVNFQGVQPTKSIFFAGKQHDSWTVILLK